MLPYVNKNMMLASDIEAKGFWDDVNSKEDIHCLCSIDIYNDKVYLFHNHPEFDNVTITDPYDNKQYTIPQRTGDLDAGVLFWEQVTNNNGFLVVHNAHKYDRWIVDKLWKNSIPFDNWIDTLIQSKVQWYERPTPKGAKGAHGLKAWGIRCGVNKPEITDWKEMDAFKLHRCIEDCRIQAKTYLLLEDERKKLKENFNIDFTQAFKIESLYATECYRQEITGAPVDIDWIQGCLVDLDNKIEALTKEIEPHLPATVKAGTSKKLSRKEIAEVLGFDASKIKEVYIKKKKNDEVIEVVEKPYYAPVTKFTSKEKCVVYQAFSLSYGVTPPFKKKKELTDYIKIKYQNTKTKEWEITKTEEITELLSSAVCSYFEVAPEDTDIVCGPFTKVSFIPSSMTQDEVVKRFLITLGWKDADDWNLAKDAYGAYIKVEEDTEVRWPKKAAPENQIVKIVKKGNYLVSSPKLSEEDYEQLPEGIGKKIAEYNTYQHRRRFISNPKDPEEKGLMAYIRPDGKIPCGINNFATRTGRGSQSVWVNAPSESALYGHEIRKIIKAPEGYKLVGIDQKSAQLSIAAYYANNSSYYTSVATGIEFDEEGNYVGQTAHCVNSRMFGMVSEDEWLQAVNTQDKELIHSISLRRKGSKGGSFCLPKDITQVYTRNGWVNFEDIYVGLEILTYNKDKKCNEFKPILNIVEFDNRPIVTMANNSWQFESTSEHRWLGSRRTGKGATRREVEEFITTDNIKSEFKIYNAAPREDIEHSLLTNNEAAILGWLLSEGSIQWSPVSDAPSTSHGTKRGVKAVIHQGVFTHAKILEDLLKAEDAYTGFTTKQSKSGTINVYNLKASYVRHLFSKAKLPFENKHKINYSPLVNNLSNSALQAFIDAFWLGDGSYQSIGSGKTISQNLGNIFNMVQEALMLLGVKTSVYRNKKYYDTQHDNATIVLCAKPHTGSTRLVKSVTRNADVFCVTTENSTFIAKQKDTITITGNCVIFGGSGKKVAKTLGISEKLGTERRNLFLTQMGLDSVIAELKTYEAMYPKSGGFFLPVAFGYWLWNNSSHKSVNTIVQGFEALCQKLAVIRFRKECERENLTDKVFKILDVHDEILLLVKEGYEQIAGKLAGNAYTWAAEQVFKYHLKNPAHFANKESPKFSIDLNGGFKVGMTYAECH